MGRKWTNIGGMGAKKLKRPESGERKNTKTLAESPKIPPKKTPQVGIGRVPEGTDPLIQLFFQCSSLLPTLARGQGSKIRSRCTAASEIPGSRIRRTHEGVGPLWNPSDSYPGRFFQIFGLSVSVCDFSLGVFQILGLSVRFWDCFLPGFGSL